MNGANVVLPNRTEQIEGIIKQKDPNFSASDLITFTKQVYIDIENAWCKRDMTPVRPVMHENLYNTTCKQVQAKIDQGVVYHYESIAIDTAYLTSYERDSQFEYVTAYLTSRMIDYQVDEKTGKIIRGDKTTRWVQKYKMKFVRSLGVETKTETGKMTGHNCRFLFSSADCRNDNNNNNDAYTYYNGNRVGVTAVAAAVVIVTAVVISAAIVASVVVTAATAVVVIVKRTYGKTEQKRRCYCRNKCYNNLLHKFLPYYRNSLHQNAG